MIPPPELLGSTPTYLTTGTLIVTDSSQSEGFRLERITGSSKFALITKRNEEELDAINNLILQGDGYSEILMENVTKISNYRDQIEAVRNKDNWSELRRNKLGPLVRPAENTSIDIVITMRRWLAAKVSVLEEDVLKTKAEEQISMKTIAIGAGVVAVGLIAALTMGGD